ncbi:restriction endonuclease subunit S [Thioclava sp.]|uniref:restriction endonuclease subunit S n=1 Tax=Thioclava sp. TaxID=1933450 RepID=UPI003AA9958F
MNAERLLQVYEQISEAPDAIARLRRFVLDLAVRGKLVEQDAADEPASVLMKAAKALQTKEGVKIKADPLQPSETPFQAPLGWLWTRVGVIALQTGSGSTPRGGKSAYADEGTPFLRSQNIYDDGLRLDDVVFISDETNQKMKRTQVKAKDLLLNITGGSIGRCTCVPDKFAGANVSQHVAIIRTAASGTEDYLHLLIRSPFFQGYVIGEQTGAGRGGLPKNRMDRIPVPLPPLAEQHRIVAKVDELMALCDRLEEARKSREELRDKLTAASLARLTAPDTTPEDFPTHANFALEALPALTTRPDQIKTLRQTILNLAVRGKLVEQDVADEPAAELLRKIDGETRKKKAAKVGSDDLLFSIPKGWASARVQDVIQPDREISYGVIKLGNEPTSGGIPTLRCSDVRPGYIETRTVRKVQEDIEAQYIRTRLEGGEVLINIRGTLGGVAHVPKALAGYNIAREVAVVPVSEKISAQYIVYLVLSPFFWDHIQGNLRGIAYKGLNLGTLRALPIPIPPLAEQHRIVAKVDALMAVCDRLEAALTTADTTRTHLLEALLHEALEPAATALEAAE